MSPLWDCRRGILLLLYRYLVQLLGLSLVIYYLVMNLHLAVNALQVVLAEQPWRYHGPINVYLLAPDGLVRR
jgi:hypothetical protein